VDVEVTVARRKPAHIERESAARALAAELHRPEAGIDLIAHIIDSTNKRDVEAVRNAGLAVQVGEALSNGTSWEIRADPITREPLVIYVAGQYEEPPAWWPANQVRNLAFLQMVAVQDATVAPPQVRIWNGLPLTSYINTLQRKAEAPQGTPGNSFIIAFDIAGLPGGFSEVPRAAAGLMPFWTAVSGILLFRDIAGRGSVGWEWKLISNPDASVPLPESLTSEFDLTQKWTTVVKFSMES